MSTNRTRRRWRSFPLKRPEISKDEQDPDKPEDPEEPIGALIVEQIENSRVSPSMRSRVEVVCDHSSVALANALEHHSLFLMPVWRLLGKASWLVKARTLPKTIGVSVARPDRARVSDLLSGRFQSGIEGNAGTGIAARRLREHRGRGRIDRGEDTGRHVKKGPGAGHAPQRRTRRWRKDQVLGDIATTNEQIFSTQRTLYSGESMRDRRTEPPAGGTGRT